MSDEQIPAAEAPAAEAPAAEPEVSSRSTMGGRRYVDAGPPKTANEGPAPGLMHVYDQKTGVWLVRRDPDYKEPGSEESREQPAPKKTDSSDVADTYKRGGDNLVLPEHLPSSVLNDPDVPVLLGEVKDVLQRGQPYMDTPHAQRLVDVFSEFYLEDRNSNLPAMMPAGPDGRAANEDAYRAILQQRWGSEYKTRLAAAQKAAQHAGPEFVAWLNRTGAGNLPAVLETLAEWGTGTMGLHPAQAKAALAEMRADPKGPLRNASHPGHKVAVAKARVLSLHAATEDDGKGGIDRKVAAMQEANDKAKGTVDEATAKIDAELNALRTDPAYMDSSRPNSKQVRARVAELYRLKYPD